MKVIEQDIGFFEGRRNVGETLSWSMMRTEIGRAIFKGRIVNRRIVTDEEDEFFVSLRFVKELAEEEKVPIFKEGRIVRARLIRRYYSSLLVSEPVFVWTDLEHLDWDWGKKVIIPIIEISNPQESTTSLVTVFGFPKGFETFEKLANIPTELEFPGHLNGKIRYDTLTKYLLFKGFMSVPEKEELLKLFKTSTKLTKLPPKVKFPKRFKSKIFYDFSTQLLSFRGIMSEVEKRELRNLSRNVLYKKAIEALFQESSEGVSYGKAVEALFRKSFVKSVEYIGSYKRDAVIHCYEKPVPLEYTYSSKENKYTQSRVWLYRDKIYRNIEHCNEEKAHLLIHKHLDKERIKWEDLRTRYSGQSPGAEEAGDYRRIPEDVRIYVWRRDKGKCVKCGSREKLEYDHIVPLSRGGSNTARNIELLCEKCNREKSDNIQ